MIWNLIDFSLCFTYYYIYIDELNINKELKNKLLSILSESESDKEYSNELLQIERSSSIESLSIEVKVE